MICLLQGISADKRLASEYGDTVGVFEGRQPALFTQDDEMMREILVKQFHNFANRRNFPFPEGTNFEKGNKSIIIILEISRFTVKL